MAKKPTNKSKNKKEITDNIWQAFAETGAVNVYLLYKYMEEK